MKHIIDVKPRDNINERELQEKLKSARSSWDYILINFR